MSKPGYKFIRAVGLAAMLLLPLCVGWLFAPLPPLHEGQSMLAIFPEEEFPLVLELRDLAGEYRNLEQGKFRKRLLESKAWDRFGLRWEVNRWQKNYFLRLAVLRLAGNNFAFAAPADDVRGRVYVLRLDNLSWACLRLVNLFMPAENVNLGPSAKRLYTRFAGRMAVSASTPEMAEEIATRLEESDLSVATPQARRSLVVRYRTSPHWQEVAARRFNLKVENIRHAQIFIARRGIGFRIKGQVSWVGRVPEDVLEHGEHNYGISYLDSLPEPSTPDEKTLSMVRGWFAPKRVWRLLNHYAWPQTGRPTAARSDPLAVALWQVMAEGFIPNADGRFALQMEKGPAPPAAEVARVPELRGAWGVHDPQKSHVMFDDGAARVIELFRAPGGADLWEAVRRETNLLHPDIGPGYDASILTLHPYFFHGMEPYWLNHASPGGDGSIIAWGTHTPAGKNKLPLRLQRMTDYLPPAGQDRNSVSTERLQAAASVLFSIHTFWKIEAEEAADWRELLFDKAHNYNWMPEKDATAVIAGAQMVEDLCRTLPGGQADLSLSLREHKSTPGQRFSSAGLADKANRKKAVKEVLFILDMDALLGINIPFLGEWDMLPAGE